MKKNKSKTTINKYEARRRGLASCQEKMLATGPETGLETVRADRSYQDIVQEAKIQMAKNSLLEKQRERRNENLLYFLREKGLCESYSKNICRIYFKVRAGKIYFLEVIEFDPIWFEEEPDRADEINNKYNTGYFDIGNACMERWKWETCAHVIYKLFVDYGFEDKESEKKALCELSKIHEWRLEISEILFRFTDI